MGLHGSCLYTFRFLHKQTDSRHLAGHAWMLLTLLTLHARCVQSSQARAAYGQGLKQLHGVELAPRRQLHGYMLHTCSPTVPLGCKCRQRIHLLELAGGAACQVAHTPLPGPPSGRALPAAAWPRRQPSVPAGQMWHRPAPEHWNKALALWIMPRRCGPRPGRLQQLS